MDATQARAFVAVAREGSFTKAARRLSRTQSTLTLSVQKLERELGHPLFERSGTGVRLTHAGKILLEDLSPLLSGWDAVVPRFREAVEGAEPTPARLVGSEAVVLHLLPPILRAHLRLHPKARLRVRALPDDEAVAAVRQGEADLAVLSARTPTAALSTRPLLSSPRVLASAREHPLSQGPRLTLDRLAAHDLLLPAKGSETHVAFDEACAREGLRVEPAMVTASYETLMRYVGLGLGVALLPGCFADRPDRRVVVRSARHLVGDERYVLAWAGRAPASRSASALLQHLASSPPVFAGAGGAREGRRR